MRSKFRIATGLFERFDARLLFLSLMTLGISLSIVYLNISNGGIFPTLFHSDPLDTFMDFFNQLYFCYIRDPYSLNKSIYPALPNLMMHLMSRLLPFEIFIQGPMIIRDSLMGIFIFMLYNIATISSLILLLYQKIQGTVIRKSWLILTIVLSAPFLYMFQRANFILVALIFLLAFLVLKDHENKWMREIAYVSLAISSVIKIYPAIFAILLLKDKDWKAIIRTTFYGIIAFVLPFIYMGGVDKIYSMLRNIYYMMLDTNFMGFAYKVNFSNTINFIGAALNVSIPSFVVTGLTLLILLMSVVSVLSLKSEWKTVGLIAVLMSGFPGFSFIYTMIFMAIPVVYFFNSRDGRKAIDYIYGFLLFLSMSPLMFINDDWIVTLAGGIYRYSLTAFAEGASLILLVIMFNIEGVRDLVEWMKKNKERKSDKVHEHV